MWRTVVSKEKAEQNLSKQSRLSLPSSLLFIRFLFIFPPVQVHLSNPRSPCRSGPHSLQRWPLPLPSYPLHLTPMPCTRLAPLAPWTDEAQL